MLLPFSQLINLKNHVSKKIVIQYCKVWDVPFAALMTFFVVSAFNPDWTLLNPSPKLGSFLAWFIASVDWSSLTLCCISSNRCFILFMTAHPICICFFCLLLVSTYLYTKCCRKPVMHLLAGNVANMSATCRPDARCCSNFGQMGPCCQHKIHNVGTWLCQLVPTSKFPALFYAP